MKNYLPAIVCAAVILALSIGPGISLPQTWWDLFSVDKLGHFIAYAALTWSLLWGAKRSNALESNGSTRTLGIILAGSILYGLLLEIVQYSYFPNRYFEVMDIIANIIGSIAGVKLSKFHF